MGLQRIRVHLQLNQIAGTQHAAFLPECLESVIQIPLLTTSLSRAPLRSTVTVPEEGKRRFGQRWRVGHSVMSDTGQNR
jgi:hypothetical protein